MFDIFQFPYCHLKITYSTVALVDSEIVFFHLPAGLPAWPARPVFLAAGQIKQHFSAGIN